MRKCTVEKYFATTHKKQLQYPHLPCLHVGPKDKNIYIPMEVTLMHLSFTYMHVTMNMYIYSGRASAQNTRDNEFMSCFKCHGFELATAT